MKPGIVLGTSVSADEYLPPFIDFWTAFIEISSLCTFSLLWHDPLRIGNAIVIWRRDEPSRLMSLSVGYAHLFFTMPSAIYSSLCGRVLFFYLSRVGSFADWRRFALGRPVDLSPVSCFLYFFFILFKTVVFLYMHYSRFLSLFLVRSIRRVSRSIIDGFRSVSTCKRARSLFSVDLYLCLSSPVFRNSCQFAYRWRVLDGRVIRTCRSSHLFESPAKL